MAFFLSIFPPQAFAETLYVPSGMPAGASLLGEALIPGLLKLLLLVAFILAFIYLLLGGISWIMSGGNKEALEGARRKVTYAVIGLIVVLLSFLILFTFGDLFGINLRNP